MNKEALQSVIAALREGRTPSLSVVPAWKVTLSSVSFGMPVMTSPLRGVSG